MSVRLRAMFLSREAMPRRRTGEVWAVCGRKRVRGSRGVCGGGVVRYVMNAGNWRENASVGNWTIESRTVTTIPSLGLQTCKLDSRT